MDFVDVTRSIIVGAILSFYLFSLYYPPQQADTKILSYFAIVVVCIYLIFTGLEKYKHFKVETMYQSLDMASAITRIIGAWDELKSEVNGPNLTKLEDAVKEANRKLRQKK